MKPAPSETADEILHRIRQQLILAQVRIMELEDLRDGLTGTSENSERLLVAAQHLVDQKTAEAGHLSTVRATLQTQFEDLTAQFQHLRHMQHVTNEALNLTRTQLESTERERCQLQQEALSLGRQITALNHTLDRLKQESTTITQSAETRLARIHQLESEILAMKATRTWRWTAWLRSIGHPAARREP